MIAKLKINIKSLAAEARFNRKEASKLKGMEKWLLNHHRQTVIRPESRVTQWLYALARGKSRSLIEPTRRDIEPFIMASLVNRAKQKASKLRMDISGLDEWLNGSVAQE